MVMSHGNIRGNLGEVSKEIVLFLQLLYKSKIIQKILNV